MVPPPDPPAPGAGNLGAFKSQPWTVFDTVAARSWLLNDTTNGLAIGTNIPAINSAGEMVFFNAPGRTTANQPWYTNIDQSGQLSYGFEVWQIYIMFAMPTFTPTQNIGYDLTDNAGVSGVAKLVEAVLHNSVVEIQLGQENQSRWPTTRFGAGGGLNINNTAAMVQQQNGLTVETNVLKLPEPIMIPRTQNLWAKIRIPPENFNLIGTVAAPGVGQPLSPYQYGINIIDNNPVVVSLQQPPFAVQIGFQGRRIKDTQYGQLPA